MISFHSFKGGCPSTEVGFQEALDDSEADLHEFLTQPPEARFHFISFISLHFRS